MKLSCLDCHSDNLLHKCNSDHGEYWIVCDDCGWVSKPQSSTAEALQWLATELKARATLEGV